jgi:sigma-B regulation protein RsbU (phosphoserine phosphatase)
MCLRPVFAQTVASLSAAYPDRSIQLYCNQDPRCAVDAVRIRQMLSNLLANAIQHGAETSPITVTAYLECDDIVLQVHNDGPPIPASLIPTLFDFAAPKSMQNSAVPTQFDHLGIGLYITRKIVEAHRGDISVSSTVQGGTRFEVRLPCPAKEHQAA